MEPGATPGIHAFIGSQCYPGAFTGFTCACASRTCLWRSSARYGGFQEPLSPEGFRRMSRLIAYMGPVSGEITLAKTYPWIAAEKAAFVAVLLGLYLLAARGIYRGEMHRACLWLLLGTSLYFFRRHSGGGGAGIAARYRLPVMPVVCVPRGSGIPARRESRSTGGNPQRSRASLQGDWRHGMRLMSSFPGERRESRVV